MRWLPAQAEEQAKFGYDVLMRAGDMLVSGLKYTLQSFMRNIVPHLMLAAQMHAI